MTESIPHPSAHVTTIEPEMDPNIFNETYQYEYLNLQGTFEIIPTIEVISQIQSKNQQQNFENTLLNFNANKARTEPMISSHILTQYSLQVGLKKFGKNDKKETQQMLTKEVFGETNQDILTSD